MADVFLALQEGLGGFEKLVVVKRIYPHLCRDHTFVRMFLDEARVAASIRHPNVVEILDIKRDDEGFFIVMEYLSGETVDWLVDELDATGRLMPWPIALAIAADIAQGLDSAHTATDEHGRPRNIVHRDVTPSNLLVTYSGTSKILDFGVATFGASNEEEGTMAGKLGYMAPEQTRGGTVDPRTDIFQLGLVLYEMLTGIRMYGDASDMASMREMLETPVPPPSAHRADLPAGVDDLVARCVAIAPEKRWSSAAALRDDIRRIAGESGQRIGHLEVGQWMSDAFADREAERASLERAALREMRQSSTGDLPAMFDAARAGTADTQVAGRGDSSPSGRRVTSPTVRHAVGAASSTAPRRGGARRRSWMRALAASAIATTAVVAWLLFGRAGPEVSEAPGLDEPLATASVAAPAAAADDGTSTVESAPEEATQTEPEDDGAPTVESDGLSPDRGADTGDGAAFAVDLEVVPGDAQVFLDGVLVGTGRYEGVLAMDGSTHRLRVEARGFEPRELVFRDTAPQKRLRLRRLRRRARSKPVNGGERPDRARTDNRDPWAR